MDYLKLVLAGFKRQTLNNFEVVIADDGSDEAFTKELENTAHLYPFLIKHVWQQDKKFRKNKILNRAIMASEGDYLIFVDGDCVPHRAFVEEHYKNSRNNLCLTGRRVNFSEKITSMLTEEKVEQGFLEKPKLLFLSDGVFGKSFDVEKIFYIKNKILREYLNRKKRGIVGCNFSAYKDDILKINGFDERYEAASVGEDTDMEFRLNLLGIQVKSLKYMAIQYHLHHKLQDRPQQNLDLFEEVKKISLPFTPFGIKQLGK